MTYEIGQQVETPLGVGEVIDVFTREDKTISEYRICFKNHSVRFGVDDLKPYKTGHDKLVEMGLSLKIINDAWSLSVFSHEWWSDDNRRIITFYTLDKLVTVYEANHDIMRIIPQYLEEMAE